MAKRKIDMVEGKLLGNIISFSVPIMLTSLMQLLYNAADIVVVGRFAGKSAMAAVGSTGALINLIINMLTGLSLGASVLAARAFGARDAERVNDVLHNAVTISLVGGVIFGVIGFFGAKTFLGWMGSPDDVIDQSALYMKIYFAGLPFNMLYLFSAGIMRAVGDSKRPMFFSIIAGIINVVLNLIFVIFVKWGVAGVAIGTVASQLCSSLMAVRALRKNLVAPKLSFRKLCINKDIFIEIAKIGLPSGMQGVFFSLSNTIVQSAVNSFSTTVIAGNTAAANLEGFVYMAMNSLYQASMTFTSQNIGAKKYGRLTKILFTCLGCVTAVGLIGGGAVYIFGSQLLSIYNSDPEVISYGLIRVFYICLPYFMCGWMDVLVGSLRGMGYSTISMIVCLIGSCALRIVWIKFIFENNRTLETLYLMYPLSWLVTAAVLFVMYLIFKKRAVAKFMRLDAEAEGALA